MKNLVEASAKAIEQPTFLKALVWIAVWENDRAVNQALKGERDADGKMWDTCFERCFEAVKEAWDNRHDAVMAKEISRWDV